jgi:hypothetical protein
LKKEEPKENKSTEPDSKESKKSTSEQEKQIDNKPNPEDTTNEKAEEQIPDHIILINPDTGERILPRWQKFLKSLSPEKRESLNKEILESYEQQQLREKYFVANGRTIN